MRPNQQTLICISISNAKCKSEDFFLIHEKYILAVVACTMVRLCQTQDWNNSLECQGFFPHRMWIDNKIRHNKCFGRIMSNIGHKKDKKAKNVRHENCNLKSCSVWGLKPWHPGGRLHHYAIDACWGWFTNEYIVLNLSKYFVCIFAFLSAIDPENSGACWIHEACAYSLQMLRITQGLYF